MSSSSLVDGPVLALVEVRAAYGNRPALLEFFADAVQAARNFGGCLGVDILVRDDEPDEVTIVERWRSREHLLAYRSWRQESGTGSAGAGARFMAGPPEMTVYQIADA
jgi:quinol monooxygenase YgiN